MSATLKTPNYNLPLFAPTDASSWMTFNTGMSLIDAGMKQIESTGQINETSITQLQNAVQSLTEGSTTSNQSIMTLQNDVKSINSNIGLINQTDVQQNQDISTLKIDVKTINTNLTPLQKNVNNLISNIYTMQYLDVQIQNNPAGYSVFRRGGLVVNNYFMIDFAIYRNEVADPGNITVIVILDGLMANYFTSGNVYSLGNHADSISDITTFNLASVNPINNGTQLQLRYNINIKQADTTCFYHTTIFSAQTN